jgi:hypothetical protein
MKLNEITLKNTHLMFEDPIEPGSGRMRFAPGVSAIGSEYHVFLPDEKAYVVAADQAEATRIQAAVEKLVKDGKTPAVITSEIKNQVGKPNGFKGTFNRQWTGATRAITQAGFEVVRNRTWAVAKLGNFIQNPLIKGIGSLMGRLGPAATFLGMVFGCAIAVDDIEVEINEGAANVDELRKLQGVLQAQMFTYLVLALKSTFGQRRLLRLVMLPIKAVVRTAQGAAVVSGVGTFPSLLSLIVTESAWLIIPLIISTPYVQRALAEYIAASVLGDIVSGAGTYATNAVELASSMTDGAYGTDMMVNVLTGRNRGFEQREADGAPTGEYYSDSDWAKKVFGGLLFPPSQASILVPYINANRRESLLNATMRLNTMDADNTAPETSTDPTTDANGDTVDANGETAADRGARTREQSLQTDYSNPNFTRAQPMNGPR